MRELKALEIAARCKITFDGQVWSVPSQSSQRTYKVTLDNPTSCTCDDFALHGPITPCKHVIAARLVRERDGIDKAPPLDTDTIPKKPTYKQNWPLYNAAQQTEKHRFCELLFDLTSRLED